MRHRCVFRKLNRTMEHRKALRRNMAQSLFEHGAIRTTIAKAKELQPFAEHLITLAKKAKQGDLKARRRIHHLMGERYMIPKEHLGEYEDMSDADREAVRQTRSGRRHRTGEGKGATPFTSESIVHRLIQKTAERYQNRTSGYTRVIHLSKTRMGDQGEQAVLQLVGEEIVPTNVPKGGKSTRRRKADMRYAAVMKAAKKKPKSAPEPASASDPSGDAPKSST